MPNQTASPVDGLAMPGGFALIPGWAHEANVRNLPKVAYVRFVPRAAFRQRT